MVSEYAEKFAPQCDRASFLLWPIVLNVVLEDLARQYGAHARRDRGSCQTTPGSCCIASTKELFRDFTMHLGTRCSDVVLSFSCLKILVREPVKFMPWHYMLQLSIICVKV